MNFNASRRLAASFMVLIVIIGTVQIFHYSSYLPTKIASHFNEKGQADAWMSLTAFKLFSLGTYYFMAGLFFFIGWIIPKLPSGLINIPNREYWMHPARRKQAIEVLLYYLYWLGVITLLYILILMQMTIKANMNHSHQLNSHYWIITAGYLIGLGYWSWKLIRHFKPVSLS